MAATPVRWKTAAIFNAGPVRVSTLMHKNWRSRVAWSMMIRFGANVSAALTLAMACAQLANAADEIPTEATTETDGDTASSAAVDAQNPIAHVISVPLQNNLYTSVGPHGKIADTLLLQPVVPFRLNADWSLVTRTIIPVIHQPAISAQQAATTGLGNIEPQFYFTPTHTGAFIWGAGAQLWLPTASNDELGYNRLGAGPALVGLTVKGHWVAGALVNNVWAGSGPRRVNLFTFNPFVNYNLRDGWYLASTPVVTANWVRPISDRWTVPLGAGAGRVFNVNGLHINARVEAFRNVRRPDEAPQTQVQLQVQVLFPENR
jgi:hypothetical protein